MLLTCGSTMRIGHVSEDEVIHAFLSTDHACRAVRERLMETNPSIITGPNFADQQENIIRRNALKEGGRLPYLSGIKRWRRDLLDREMLKSGHLVWQGLPLIRVAQVVLEGRLPQLNKEFNLGINAIGSQESILRLAEIAESRDEVAVFHGSIWHKREDGKLILRDGTHRCLGLAVRFLLRDDKANFPRIYCYVGESR